MEIVQVYPLSPISPRQHALNRKSICHISPCSSSTLFSEAIKPPPSRVFAYFPVLGVLSRLLRSELQTADTSITRNPKPSRCFAVISPPPLPPSSRLLRPISISYYIVNFRHSLPAPLLSLMHFTSELRVAAASRVIRPGGGLLQPPVIE